MGPCFGGGLERCDNGVCTKLGAHTRAPPIVPQEGSHDLDLVVVRVDLRVAGWSG